MSIQQADCVACVHGAAQRLFAVIVPLGFEGGHGVVAGTRQTFEDLNYTPGYDLAMVGATVGLLAGTGIGFGLVNWAALRKQSWNQKLSGKAVLSTEQLLLPATEQADCLPADARPRRRSASMQAFNPDRPSDAEAAGTALCRQALLEGNDADEEMPPGAAAQVAAGADWNGVYFPSETRPANGRQTVAVSSLDNLALHLAVVGVVLLLAWAGKLGLTIGVHALERRFGERSLIAGLHLVSSLPLFLFSLLAAVGVQAVVGRLGPRTVMALDRRTAESLCATAMDFLVVAAIA